MSNTQRINTYEMTKEKIEFWLKEIKEYNTMSAKTDIISKLPPLMQLEIEYIASYLLNQANHNDKEITSDLHGFVDNKMYLVELDNRIKGKKRLKEKIYYKSMDKQISIMEAIPYIRDVLRYTFIIDNDQYIEKIDECLTSLESSGYKVIDFCNNWNELLYRDIDVKLENSQGFLFEIQFHTQNSYQIKEEKTRELYNLLRNRNVPIDLLVKANILRKFYQQQVIIPYGSLDYVYEIKNKKSKIK